MEKLYYIDLFNQTINFLKTTCSVSIQFYIKLSTGKERRIFLLKVGCGKEFISTDRYILVGFDDKQQTIIPLRNKEIEEIIELVKQVDIDQNYKQLFMNVKSVNYDDLTGLCSINQNLSIFATHKGKNSSGSLIKVSIVADEKIVPSRFCFSAINRLDQNAYIEIKSLPYEKYYSSHLLDRISFYLGQTLVGKLIVEKLKFDNKMIKLRCSVYEASILKNTSTSKLIARNVNVFDMMELNMKTAGLDEISINIPDQLPSIYRWYTVIMPIINLDIAEEFGVGNIRFLKSTNQAVQILHNHVNNTSEEINRCYAKVYVNEYTFYNAIIKAKAQINQALDFIINIARDDSFYSCHGLSNKVVEKDISYFSAKAELEKWVYIVDSFNDQSIIFNAECINTNSDIQISKGVIEALSELEKFELMMIKLAEHENKETEPMFNALKWIRKAWDSSDKDDQIINSIIALEFVVASEKNQPLLKKSHKRVIKKTIEKEIREHCTEEADIDKLIENVNQKFDFVCSDTPFFVKLNSLISRLNIPVSSDNIALIKTARTKRNDIVHGRSSENLSLNNIRTLCEVISVITFYKLNSLEVK